MDGGVLGLVAVAITDAAEANQFLAMQALGQARRFAGWMEWTAPRFEISSAGPVEIGVDGEALTMDPPLVFESRPGALQVRLPRHALRVSPAARAVHVLSVSTFAGLARIAVGSNPR
jgi:diacylglycerol kinase family enzyme